jgi:hypothetical protein
MRKGYFEALFSREVLELPTVEEQHEAACKASGVRFDRDDEYYLALRAYLYDTRRYEMEEYFSGRVLYASLGATVREGSLDMGKDREGEYNLKLKNFGAMKDVAKRLRELEQGLFGLDEVAIEKATLDTKKFAPIE